MLRRCSGVWLPGLIVAAIGLAGGGSQASAVPLTVAAPTQTVVSTFAVEADTRVHEAFPTTNYGARVVLRVDGAGDPDIESFLRFTVSGLAGSVQRATLRLHVTEGTTDGPRVFGTSNDWVELAMTWSDRPPPTTAAADDEGAIATDSWAEFDVTSLVSTGGTFSFVLAATSPNSADFDSRESTSTSLRPELLVETLTSNAPVNASPPTISGTLQEGATLTAAPGSWNGSQPMSFAYQWQRCNAAGAGCSDIAGADGESRTLTQSDVGATLQVLVTATNADGSATAASAPTNTVIGAGDVVIAAAGDIANCSSNMDEATAQLLDSIAPTRVLTLGDNVYPDGADAEFAACYEPTWGRHKAKTHPSVGNHDYHQPGAAGYFNYFGAAAGDPTQGYYAFDLGAWRLYALNSNCSDVPCAAGSAQEQWLRTDLAAHPRSCIAAFMHHPRFSSNLHGNTVGVSDLWNALYDYAADVVLMGHDHGYERFTRLGPTGAIDLERGIRSFVVGTGGAGLYPFGTPVTGSEVRGGTHGVLKLILRDAGYDWAFVPAAGATFTDSGTDTCGSAPNDPTPPSDPTGLVSTSAEAGNVGLGWDASADDVGVVAYDVYRDAQLLASTTSTSHIDTSAVGGTTYEYNVTARDAAGNTSGSSNTVTVMVSVANQPPAITSNGGSDTASLSGPENSTTVTTVAATDGDGDTLTYAISGGADAADLTINPSSGVLTFASPPDYEAPADANTDNFYEVTVEASDGSLSDTQALTVEVTNVVPEGSPPLITSDGGGPTAALSGPENSTAVTTVTATDPDVPPDPPLTYSITAGADMLAFTIVPSTGALTFLNAPNYELPGDVGLNNVYDVVVQASDGSLTDTQTLAVTVTNVNEFAPVISSDGGGTSAALSKSENSTAVTDVDATDADLQTLTYSISGGPDAATFAIVPASGVLTFVTAPNFESPSDAGLNNVYDVTVEVSDGNGASDSQALAVTVTDVVESAGSPLYFSLTSAGTVGGVSAADEDVVFFDGSGFSLAFDGSDVGISGFRIDAFSWVDATSLLLSFDGAGTVPDAGSVDDSDVVLFTATSLGDVTAGTFSMHFDGSDVGLTTSNEDVDAFELLHGGHILLSTSGAVSVTGVAGEDKDILEFIPTSLGATTAGTYSLYFDGSDVELTASSEDVDAAAVDSAGKVYLSTTGNFAVTGRSGADEDVFVFTPTSLGATTAGTYSSTLYFDGSVHGLAANDVFAIDLP